MVNILQHKQVLISQDLFALGEVEDLVWHKQVPLKFSIFVWHLMRDSLPTKTNLVACDIISPEVHLYVYGCGDIESAWHLFLSCSTFGSLWALVRSWIGFSAAMSTLFVTTLFDSLSQLEVFEIFAAHLASLRLSCVE
jgi:hypothetical protein